MKETRTGDQNVTQMVLSCSWGDEKLTRLCLQTLWIADDFTMLCFTVYGLMELALCEELHSASERIKPAMVKPRVTPPLSELAQMR